MRRFMGLPAGVAVLLIFLFANSLAKTNGIGQPASPQTLDISPLCFTENQGQWDGQALFRADAGGAILWFAGNEVYYQFIKRIPRPDSDESDLHVPPFDKFGHQPDSIEQLVIKAILVDANPNPVATGLDVMEYKCNYFIGSDPDKWHTDVPNYQAIQLHDIYPGIDLKYYGNKKQMEYDFVISPGVDYGQIQIQYEGAESLSINSEGELVVATAWGNVIERRPIIYQTDSGNRLEIEGRYELLSEHSFSFKLDDSYNSALPLIIDPVLVYSTYLGGNSLDGGKSIAVDTLGCVYITGGTYSYNFPTYYQYEGFSGDLDIFITKLSSSGNELIYSTYIGGYDWDLATGLAIDGSCCAYITGNTSSPDYPTHNPFQTFQGYYDALVTKLSSSGNDLIYSTFLGGSNGEEGNDIAVDDLGQAIVTGYTISIDFPVLNPFQMDQDTQDIFITKFSPSGGDLVYSTYFGGSKNEGGIGIAVDHSGNAYVTGVTYSSDFPVINPFQAEFKGDDDIFAIKISPIGDFYYRTYIGRDSIDTGYDIAVDANGCAYISGRTFSTDFPTINSFQQYNGMDDACAIKLSATGNELLYSTLFGGTKSDRGFGIAVDRFGYAYVTGKTISEDYPVLNPYQVYQGISDAIITKISPSGSFLIYSTYLGGRLEDEAYSIDVDDSGNAYVVGETYSSDFPVLNPYQTDQPGSDVFVTKFPPSLLGEYAIFAIDKSGSMVYTDPRGWSRLERAKLLAHEEIDKLLDFNNSEYPGVFQVAILTFNADGIELVQDFTSNSAVLQSAIDQISNPRHDTPLAAAMCQAHCALTDLEALAKYVFTFTDGLENESQNFDMCILCEPCNDLIGTGWNYDCDPSNPSSCTDWQMCLHEQFSQTGINVVHYFGEPLNPFDKGNVSGLEDMYFLKNMADESKGQFVYHSDQVTVCGDANGDGNLNVSDAAYLISYIFIGGTPPAYMKSGDCNCDGTVNVSDAIKIINYVFIAGNAPCDTNGDGIPDC